jgi:colanic acid/amylovoran biosynthesis protein
LFGKLHKAAPGVEHVMRHAAPMFSATVTRARLRRRRMDDGNIIGFIERMHEADLVVTSGGGYVTDSFPWLAERVLRTIILAQDLGKRTAMLGQGLGPIESPRLRKLAARAFSRLDLLTLREADANLPLLRGLGVSTDRVVVTGDDAIESAYPKINGHALGNGIGANLRLTRYSASGAEDTLAAVRDVLRSASARHHAPLVPVPISYNDDGEDVRVLRQLLGREDIPADESAQDPRLTVAAAASCRVVVTGSYHAAVFALSNGVPAVAVAASPYYIAKFAGLRTQFDGGCAVVRRDQPGWPEELSRQIDHAWSRAESLRPTLLAAARRQVELGRAAYRRMTEWFRGG